MPLVEALRHKCEVCKSPAGVPCKICEVTYYCTTEHKDDDWESMHQEICARLADIRQYRAIPAIGSERMEIKEHNKFLKTEIIQLARQRLEEYFIERKYNLAIAAVSQCIFWITDLHGNNCIELIAPYSILSEICIEFNDAKQAADSLSQAEWINHKTEHKADDRSLALLYRALGRVSWIESKWLTALYAFAEHVYYTCSLRGVGDIGASCSFYYLGVALFQNGNKGGAISAYQHLSTQWQECLMKAITTEWVEIMFENKHNPPPPVKIEASKHQIIEGFRLTNLVTNWCYRVTASESLPSLYRLMFTAFHAEGLFHLLKHDVPKAKYCLYQASLAGIQCHSNKTIDSIATELEHAHDILNIINEQTAESTS